MIRFQSLLSVVYLWYNRGLTIAYRVACEDPIHRMEEQQCDTLGTVSLNRLLILA